jgi:hypothetical protein
MGRVNASILPAVCYLCDEPLPLIGRLGGAGPSAAGFGILGATFVKFRTKSSREGIGISSGSPLLGCVICVGPRRASARSQASRATSRSRSASRRSISAPSGSPRWARNRADSSRSATRLSADSASLTSRFASLSAACVGPELGSSMQSPYRASNPPAGLLISLCRSNGRTSSRESPLTGRVRGLRFSWRRQRRLP